MVISHFEKSPIESSSEKKIWGPKTGPKQLIFTIHFTNLFDKYMIQTLKFQPLLDNVLLIGYSPSIHLMQTHFQKFFAFFAENLHLPPG